MAITIATVSCEIPGGFGEFIPFESKLSLLDYDIILFEPDIANFRWSRDDYQGKPSLDDSRSVRLIEAANHWKREIAEALRAGKTVFFLLAPVQEVYIDSGKREYSGTGRNRQVTRIVTPFNNYQVLPIALPVTAAEGSSMVLSSSAEVLASYWGDFGRYSRYHVVVTEAVGNSLVVTRSGRRTVGLSVRLKGSHGNLVLLPFVQLSQEEFYTEVDSDEGATFEWTEQGRAFGGRFRDALERIDAALKERTNSTPEPEWASAPEYSLPAEAKLRQELLEVEGKLTELETAQQRLKDGIVAESGLRHLLYEKGRNLESTIRQALEIIGFVAAPFRESDSEFDVVFESPEGRFLGEAEGKDNKAISIDKLRQLEMNILEDLNREEVEVPAKGVLFGNAYRLQPLEERGEFFTEKVMVAAKRTGTALVRTVDLFRVAQFLSGACDEDFAAACRQSLLKSAGDVVVFPEIPRKP